MSRSTKPPPNPIHVFRPTHPIDYTQKENKKIINHLDFIQIEHLNHVSLLTLDNQGWITIWNLESKRVDYLWLAHPDTLSIGGGLWAAPLHSYHNQSLFIISQGRDGKLKIFEINKFIENVTISTISRANLIQNSSSNNVKLIVETLINSVNFCKAHLVKLEPHLNHFGYLVVLPGSMTEELVDVFGIQFEPIPKIVKVYQSIPTCNLKNNSHPRGSVVAVQLFTPPGIKENELMILIIGYESGEINILKNQKLHFFQFDSRSDWEILARFKCHTEPVLSITTSIDPDDPFAGNAWSVGADKNIVKYHFSCSKSDHKLMGSQEGENQIKYHVKTEAMVFETNQLGRFDIKVRSDSKIIAIYSWGGKIWFFDTKGKPTQNQIQNSSNDDYFHHFTFFKLCPIGLLNVPTDPSNKSGVLAFSPFPPSTPTHTTHQFDSLLGLSLFVASGLSGHVTAWETFPPKKSHLFIS